MSTTRLFLIRHGETDWNVADKIQGQTDIPLNVTGKEQAKKMTHFLKKKQVSFTALYSSDLQRAHQTAQEIAAVFELEIILAADLREGHFGKAEGITKKEWHALYGAYDHQTLPAAIEGEPRDQVVKRVMNYLNTIAQKHKGQNIAVVTHGGALRSLLTHLGHNVSELPALTNTSIVTFMWCDNRKMFIFESIENAK